MKPPKTPDASTTGLVLLPNDANILDQREALADMNAEAPLSPGMPRALEGRTLVHTADHRAAGWGLQEALSLLEYAFDGSHIELAPMLAELGSALVAQLLSRSIARFEKPPGSSRVVLALALDLLGHALVDLGGAIAANALHEQARNQDRRRGPW